MPSALEDWQAKRKEQVDASKSIMENGVLLDATTTPSIMVTPIYAGRKTGRAKIKIRQGVDAAYFEDISITETASYQSSKDRVNSVNKQTGKYFTNESATPSFLSSPSQVKGHARVRATGQNKTPFADNISVGEASHRDPQKKGGEPDMLEARHGVTEATLVSTPSFLASSPESQEVVPRGKSRVQRRTAGAAFEDISMGEARYHDPPGRGGECDMIKSKEGGVASSLTDAATPTFLLLSPSKEAWSLRPKPKGQHRTLVENFDDISVGQIGSENILEKDGAAGTKHSRQSATEVIIASTPSFLASSPESQMAVPRGKPRVQRRSAGAVFEDISMEEARYQNPPRQGGESDMTKSNEGGVASSQICAATPTFLQSPLKEACSSRFKPRGQHSTLKANFDDICIGEIGSEKRLEKDGMPGTVHARDSFMEEAESPTSSSLASSPESQEVVPSQYKPRFQRRTVGAVFEDISMGEVRYQDPGGQVVESDMKKSQEGGVSSSQTDVATPSFLRSLSKEDCYSRPKPREQHSTLDANFDDISMGEICPPNRLEKGGVPGIVHARQGSTSVTEAATPSILVNSPQTHHALHPRGMPRVWRTASDAVFNDINLGETNISDPQEKGGKLDGIKTLESTTKIAPAEAATPTFLRSPSKGAELSRYKPRKKHRAPEAEFDDISVIEESYRDPQQKGGEPDTMKTKESHAWLTEASTPSVLDSSPRSQEVGEPRGKVRPQSKSAEAVLEDIDAGESSSPASQGRGGATGIITGSLGPETVQKLEVTRALRASRKSEVLGYLVRYGQCSQHA